MKYYKQSKKKKKKCLVSILAMKSWKCYFLFAAFVNCTVFLCYSLVWEMPEKKKKTKKKNWVSKSYGQCLRRFRKYQISNKSCNPWISWKAWQRLKQREQRKNQSCIHTIKRAGKWKSQKCYSTCNSQNAFSYL